MGAGSGAAERDLPPAELRELFPCDVDALDGALHLDGGVLPRLAALVDDGLHEIGAVLVHAVRELCDAVALRGHCG